MDLANQHDRDAERKLRMRHRVETAIAFAAGALVLFALMTGQTYFLNGDVREVWSALLDRQGWVPAAVFGFAVLATVFWSMSSWYRRLSAEAHARVLAHKLALSEDRRLTEEAGRTRRLI